MSVFRASRYRLAPALPDLTDVQYEKFNDFLATEVAKSLHEINPIELPDKNLSLVLYPDLYQFVVPQMTEHQALALKKTYNISLYVPGHVFLGHVPVEKPQWLYLGKIPIMTSRGHFIINGCARVLVHQILRRPGVYFKEKIQGTGAKEKRVIWADFICQRGSWVRIQRDKKKRFWFCLKNMPKLDLNQVIDAMAALEDQLEFNTPPSENARLAIERLEQRLDQWSTKPGLRPQGDGALDFLATRFKNPKVYCLGESARYEINRKLHVSEETFQLTANDLRQTKEYLIALDQNRYVPDDIDNLSNRRVWTSSELYKARFDNGLALLSRSVQERFKRLKRMTSARLLIDTKAFTQAFRECFYGNPLAQFLDQVNPLSDVTHKRRIYATGPGGVSQENASLDMRSIHPTYYGRICPIETPEGKRAGLVNSLTVFGRVSAEGFLETPYYRVFQGQIQTRSPLRYMTTAQEQGNAATVAPVDLGRDRCEVVTGVRPVPARVATEIREDFLSIPRDKVEYIGLGPPQLMSIATSLIPFLEHNDANRALMGSNMQRQTVPPMRPTRPIVSTGFEKVVVGESGHAVTADRAGIVSYVSGRVIEVSSGPLPPRTKASKVARTLEPQIRLDSLCPGFLPTRTWYEASSPAAPAQAHTDDTRVKTHGWQKGMTKSWLNRGSGVRPQRQRYGLHTYERSNQETALTQRPAVREGKWVQRGDLLADCGASVGGHLTLGHNLLIAYVPWEGYNFEDAVVISERLISDDLYTTIHVEKFDTEAQKKSESIDDVEVITRHLLPKISDWNNEVLDDKGVIRVGQWVEPGDILVRKIVRVKQKPLNPHLRLVYDILEEKPPTNKDVSLRVPRGVRGRVINTQILDHAPIPPLVRAELKQLGYTDIPELLPSKVRVLIAEKRRIQIGDKVAGRHGNKGIVSCILRRQDMPYLPDGRAADMVLNPLGVPSRMNVGQVFECLLGLAGSYLHQEFRISPFDEIFGAEASRSIVFLKLYQARLKTRKRWLFQPNFPGKVRVFDGRTGDCFEQFVTVGCAYMLKLVHLVDEKIHARTHGHYTMVMEQPVGGRSRGGGQRLGEMEVWALEAFGAAYILQEMLTIKSDDFEGRATVTESAIDPVWTVNEDQVIPEHLPLAELEKLKELPLNLEETKNTVWAKDFRYKPGLKFGLGVSDGFRVLVRELQSLCLDVGVYGLSAPTPKDGKDYETFVKLRPYTNLDAHEAEAPITKREIRLCDPLGNGTDYQQYSRQYKSQFGFDF